MPLVLTKVSKVASKQLSWYGNAYMLMFYVCGDDVTDLVADQRMHCPDGQSFKINRGHIGIPLQPGETLRLI